MVQLVINGTEYPTTSEDKYKCYLEDSGEDLDMQSGRTVSELGFKKVVVEYSYDFFKDDLRKTCLADLRTKNDLEVAYYDPEKDEVQFGVFKCVTWPDPSIKFTRNNVPYWHNYTFKLRGVDVVD